MRPYSVDEAAAFVDRVEERADPWSRAVAVARQPSALARAVALVPTLPTIDVRLTGTAAGRMLQERHFRRPLGLPLYAVAQSVLTLPGSTDAYLRGRSRQAVRTALTRARVDGLTAHEVTDRRRRDALVEEVFARRGASGEQHDFPAMLGPVEHFVVVEQDGAALALAVVWADAELAHLATMLAVQDPAVSSTARYLLHTRVVTGLVDLGVHHLTLGSALRGGPGLRFFRDRLGYRTVNLRLVR